LPSCGDSATSGPPGWTSA